MWQMQAHHESMIGDHYCQALYNCKVKIFNGEYFKTVKEKTKCPHQKSVARRQHLRLHLQ